MTKEVFPYPAKELAQLEDQYSFASDDIYYYNTHRPGILVRQLQQRLDEFDPQLVPPVFAKALGEKVVHQEISRLFGTGHIIVFVKTDKNRELVLRATHALTQPEKYMDMEADVIARYLSVGIPSTEIIASDASRENFPFDYQIMLPLTGKDLENEWSGDKSSYDQLSLELGRMLARQYQLPGKGWGRWKRNESGEIVGAKSSHHDYLIAYLDHDLAVLDLFGLTDPHGIGVLQEFFNSPGLTSLFHDETQSYFVHHDVADHNIRYLGAKVTALYDWENAVLYDPISDIGSAPTWKTHYPREKLLRQGFIEQLGRKPDNFESKADVYFLRTMLWKLQFALKGKRLNARHLELTQDALNRNGLSIVLNSNLIA